MVATQDKKKVFWKKVTTATTKSITKLCHSRNPEFRAWCLSKKKKSIWSGVPFGDGNLRRSPPHLLGDLSCSIKSLWRTRTSQRNGWFLWHTALKGKSVLFYLFLTWNTSKDSLDELKFLCGCAEFAHCDKLLSENDRMQWGLFSEKQEVKELNFLFFFIQNVLVLQLLRSKGETVGSWCGATQPKLLYLRGWGRRIMS